MPEYEKEKNKKDRKIREQTHMIDTEKLSAGILWRL